MAGLATRLRQVWYEGARVPLWLAALVPLYRAARALHLIPFRSGWRTARRLPVAVVVVGNLTAGGTGKTPLVIALVDALRARGHRPGVVSRGYGGNQRQPLLLDDLPLPSQVGDEPCLIRRRSGVEVAVGRDRARAAELLIARGVDVVIADDGLQNPALARDVEICVIDGQRRFGNTRFLPAGPLREPLSRLRDFTFQVCNGGAAQAGEVPMQLVGDIAVAIDRIAQTRHLDEFSGQRVHAVAAIGNPQRFFLGLRAHGIDVEEHPFADHHAFVAQDLNFGDELPVLMTEKDAIKCTAFAGPRLWCVPVRAELPVAFFDELSARIKERRERESLRSQ